MAGNTEKNSPRDYISRMVALSLLALPSYVFASVFMSEVAWMGNATSASNEWIELQNDGGNVDLSGWILRIEGANDINLSGEIKAGGYYLIERTDDESVPNITADVIAPFKNGLSNSGEILVLLDQSGAVADKIVSGEGWADIGGDNTTKHTAQKTSGSWITAASTPKAINASVASSPPPSSSGAPTEAQTQTPASDNQPSNTTATTYEEPKRITADAGENETATAGTRVIFEGSAMGLQNKPLPDARLLWSFGDGATAEGKKVEHTFIYPGTYTISLTASSGEWSDTDRIKIEVHEATISISAVDSSEDGFITLSNNNQNDADISRWSLLAGQTAFYFPDNTFIGSSSKTTFPNPITKLAWSAGEKIVLRYPNLDVSTSYNEKNARGNISLLAAASANDTRQKTNAPETTVKSPTKKVTGAPQMKPAETSPKEMSGNGKNEGVLEANRAITETAGIANGSQKEGLLKWLFALAVVMLLSLLAFFTVPKEKKYLAEDFKLIEEKDE